MDCKDGAGEDDWQLPRDAGRLMVGLRTWLDTDEDVKEEEEEEVDEGKLTSVRDGLTDEVGFDDVEIIACWRRKYNIHGVKFIIKT